MNGIKIKKDDWMKLKPGDRDGALFDFIVDFNNTLNKNMKKIYIIIGVIGVLFLVAHPEWAKFLIGKAVASLP